MRYLMKEKLWSFGNDFHIKDEHEENVYFIDGQAFSWGDKLSFQDMQGHELAFISQKLISFKPRYEIFRDGKKFAEVVKEFTWFKNKFTLDVPGPNDYTITGSFWEHEFQFERQGREVASISKKYFSWSDTYGIEITEGEDEISILATCVVIDLVCHEDNNN